MKSEIPAVSAWLGAGGDFGVQQPFPVVRLSCFTPRVATGVVVAVCRPPCVSRGTYSSWAVIRLQGVSRQLTG